MQRPGRLAELGRQTSRRPGRDALQQPKVCIPTGMPCFVGMPSLLAFVCPLVCSEKGSRSSAAGLQRALRECNSCKRHYRGRGEWPGCDACTPGECSFRVCSKPECRALPKAHHVEVRKAIWPLVWLRWHRRRKPLVGRIFASPLPSLQNSHRSASAPAECSRCILQLMKVLAVKDPSP
jgi:hypothetical protein